MELARNSGARTASRGYEFDADKGSRASTVALSAEIWELAVRDDEIEVKRRPRARAPRTLTQCMIDNARVGCEARRAPAAPTLVPTRPGSRSCWRVQVHDPPLDLTRAQSGEGLVHLFGLGGSERFRYAASLHADPLWWGTHKAIESA